jgi:excinuclease UvrABC nuclease subunit
MKLARTKVKVTNFTQEDLAALTRPCVYLFVKAGRVLYVGSSKNGIVRFGSGDHHKRFIRAQCDKIRVLWQDSEAEARRVEGQMIRKYLWPELS